MDRLIEKDEEYIGL